MLRQIDYLTAAEVTLKNAGSLAHRFLRHYIWPLIGALVLLIAGIVVMFVADNAAGVVSGAAAIIAGPRLRLENDRHLAWGRSRAS